MPEYRVDVKVDPTQAVSGSREAKEAIGGINSAVLSLNQTLELLQKGFALLRSAVELPVRQFKSLFDASADLVRKYDEQILAQTKLLTVLKATGEGSEDQARHLEALAESLQRVTRFDDDAIVAGQALAIGLGVPIDQMERFSKAAVELAAFLDGDVTQAFRQLNLAVQTGGIRGLKADITDATDPAQRFNDVLTFIEKNLGDIAEQTAKVGAGPLEQLSQVFNDFEQALGKVIADSPQFQAFIDHMKQGLQELIGFINENGERLSQVFGNLFVASFNLAKAALLTFVEVAKAAFQSLLDLFLKVADSRLGKLLNLNEGLGDLTRYREAIQAVEKDENSLRIVEGQLTEQQRKRKELVDQFAATPARDDAQEMIRGAALLQQDEGIRKTQELADRLTGQLRQSNEELSKLRNSALGIKPEGIFSPLLAAAGQLDGVLAEGKTKVEEIVGLFTAPLNAPDNSLAGAAEDPELAKIRQLGIAGGGKQQPIRDFAAEARADLQAQQEASGQSYFEETKQNLVEVQTLYGQFAQTVPTTADAVIGGIHSMASSLTDTIVQFSMTGKASIADFARSAIADIERIIVQTLILKAVQAGLGATFGDATTTTVPAGGAKAAGGPVLPGRSYLVGEEGPELVSFGQPGTVTPARETAAAMRGGVTVRVVDVRNEDELAAQLNSGKYDREVVAVLRRNQGLVAQI